MPITERRWPASLKFSFAFTHGYRLRRALVHVTPLPVQMPFKETLRPAARPWKNADRPIAVPSVPINRLSGMSEVSMVVPAIINVRADADRNGPSIFTPVAWPLRSISVAKIPAPLARP